MFSVVVYELNDEGFWLDEEKEFETFWQALSFATSLDFPYEIYKDFHFISAQHLVARSTYDLWSC